MSFLIITARLWCYHYIQTH